MQTPEFKNPKPARRRCGPIRQLVQTAVLILICLLIFRAVGAEPYQVPTGSMWPALAGNHRAIACPRCGYPVMVGRHRSDPDGTAGRYYRDAVCPNCGYARLGLDHVPECPGDHLLVNKSVFDLRRPRRWEPVVFRATVEPTKAFVKRVVGLPGERVRIQGGDVYINGELARKTLAEFKALRIPVFDNNYQPEGDGFRERWEVQPPRTGPSPLHGTTLALDATDSPDRYRCLVYRHCSLDDHQSLPLQDEYAYNCGDPGPLNSVHDFMMECDLEVQEGDGRVLLGITDGHDNLVAEVPVGGGGEAVLRDTEARFSGPPRADRAGATVYRRAPEFRLEAGRTYHVELAFVDRRLTLAVDGRCPFEPLDLPPAETRADVIRPVEVGGRGVKLALRNFRLFRDIYYTDAGENATAHVVSLGPGEYFVLGDNSPYSDDSRVWRQGEGAVPEANLIGKPFLVHLPNRVVHWGGADDGREFIAPDWGRIHWLR